MPEACKNRQLEDVLNTLVIQTFIEVFPNHAEITDFSLNKISDVRLKRQIILSLNVTLYIR